MYLLNDRKRWSKELVVIGVGDLSADSGSRMSLGILGMALSRLCVFSKDTWLVVLDWLWLLVYLK